ncbi:MAG: PorT family protein [Cyclobacteriaceae bacterium]|nr:PorT family protein [Cyclobacteriaceae bacterium]
MEDKNHHRIEVRKILTDYEVPYEKGAWERFEQKRNRKRSFIIFYKAAGIAASISLIVFAVLFQNELFPGASQETIIYRQAVEKDTLEQKEKDITNADNALDSDEGSSLQNLISSETDTKVKKQSEQPSGKTDVFIASNNQFYNNTNAKEEGAKINPLVLNLEKISPIGLSFNLSPQTIPSLVTNHTTMTQSSLEEHLLAKQNMEELEAKTNNTPIVFGIVLSSLMSSSPGTSSPQPGVGGGLTTEIPFNEKFALYTGVHLSDQTLTSEVNENPSVLTGSKALQSVTTDLLNLDIPVNIRYTFSERKDNAMYVAVGVSSLAYLGEKTESEFLIPNIITTYQEGQNGKLVEVYQTVQISETEIRQSEAFEQFDLAGQLNLSFGYSYKLNSQLRLIVEPYYKHPLSRLSSSELSFSTAGVNLRLNLGLK